MAIIIDIQDIRISDRGKGLEKPVISQKIHHIHGRFLQCFLSTLFLILTTVTPDIHISEDMTNQHRQRFVQLYRLRLPHIHADLVKLDDPLRHHIGWGWFCEKFC